MADRVAQTEVRSWLKGRGAGDVVSAIPSRPVVAASQVAGAAIAKAGAIWSGLWLVGLSFAVATGSSDFRSMPVAMACLAALWLAWGASLVTRVAPAWLFVGAAVVTALLIEVNAEPKSLGDPYSALVLWLGLAALTCGFVLSARRARRVIESMCAISLLVGLAATIGTVAEDGDPLWRAVVAIQVYSLVIGMATIGGMRAIRRAAAQADEATSARIQAQGAEAREATTRAESFRIARALHDGPLNTLAALRIGSIDPRSLQERCAADQRSIDQLLRSQPSIVEGQQTALARVVAVASERARLLGLRLRVDAAQGADQGLDAVGAASVDHSAMPPEVENAICGAVAEALLNASKHSGSRQAELSVVSEPSGITVTVTDDGRGFDGSRQLAPLSIVRRCEDVGVRATVTSRAQRGTAVTLRWAPPIPQVQDVAATSEFGGDVLTKLARQVAAWFVLLFLALTLLDVGQGSTWSTLVALILFAAIALGAAHGSSTPLPVWLRWVLALGAGALVWVPRSTWTQASQVSLQWWGAEAGLVLVLLMVFLVGRLVWVALSSGFFMIGIGFAAFDASTGGLAHGGMPQQGGTPQEEIAIAVTVALIVSGVIYGAWRLRQLIIWFTASAKRSLADAVAARARLVAATERDRVRQTWARSVLMSTRDFMAELAADGGVTDAQTLVRCEREETMLRAVVSIDAAWGELGQALIALVGWANERNIRAQVRAVSFVALPTPEQAAEIEAALRVELTHAQVGTEVVFTVGSSTGTGGSLITVLELDRRSAGDAMTGHTSGPARRTLDRLDHAGVTTTCAVEGDQLLIQMKWQATGS